MKQCAYDAVKNELHRVGSEWLKEFNDTNGTDYKLGQSYFIPEWETVRQLEQFLDAKVNDFDSSLVGHLSYINSISADGKTIRLEADWDTVTEKILTNENTATPIRQRMTETMKSAFQDKQEELTIFTKRALDNLSKLKDIKELQDTLKDINAQGEVRETIKYLELNLDKDLEDKVNSFLSFILSTNTQAEALLEAISDLDNFMQAKHIYDAAVAHYKLFNGDNSLTEFLALHDNKNPVTQLIRDTVSKINSIESRYLQIATQEVAEKLFTTQYDAISRRQNRN